MTTTVDISQNPPSLAELLKITQAGNEVIFVQSGQTIARLVPVSEPQAADQQVSRTPGAHPGSIVFLDDDWDAPLPDEFWLGGNS